MKRALLIVSGGIEAIPGIQKAREMGLRVVVSDANPRAPGFAFADDRLIASTYDVQESLAVVRDYHHKVRPINGVMTIAADVPLTVATIAEALGLPGIPVASARLAMDKLAMKDRFSVDEVPIPWYRSVTGSGELREIVKERGYPLILKPVDSRGARGVFRLTEGINLDWAFNASREVSPTGRVMVEAFLSGPQVSTESIVIDSIAHTLGFSDRNYEFMDRYAPHIIENGGSLPSFLEAEQQSVIKALVQQAARSMGIQDGVVKGDIVLSGGKPFVIELAARLSGGYFCSHEIPLNTGVDFLGQAIKLALGETPSPAELTPRFQRAVAQRYLFPEAGRVVSIEGVDKVNAWEGIAFSEIRVKPGDFIGPVDSHVARAGMVITTGPSREEAITLAQRAISRIRIVTELVAPNYIDSGKTCGVS